MLSSMKYALAIARSRLANLSGSLRLIVAVSALVAASLVLLWIFDKIFLFFMARSFADEIAEAFDLNRHLAKAITWLVFAAGLILIRYIFSFSKLKRRAALAGLLALLIGHSLVLWRGTSDDLTNRDGKAIKCYVITRDGVIYREQPGFDPSTGRECRPVTPELVERLREYERGNRPTRIETPHPEFFDRGTGRPIVWLYKNKINEIELFNLMGFHPETGDELEPVSKEIVELWKKQAAKTYYTITRDGVRYSNKPGIDQLTGRQWREMTDQLLERLREYERGKRPTKVVSNDPIFFDRATGEPIVWYLKTAAGEIELFDLMGFHPATGEELLPVTKEVANEWNQQRPKCVPAPVKIGPDTRIFDPATGSSQLWFWRSMSGEYEFFDCGGFHPRNGEALKSFDREAFRDYENDVRDKEKQLRTEQERLQKEREDKEKQLRAERERLQKEREDKEKQLRAEQERLQKEQEEQERKKTEQKDKRDREEAQKEKDRGNELRRKNEAARLCDELAANPNDSRKVTEGVPFDALKTQAREARENCELAIAQNPTELRFRYQLGRALEWIDRNKALQIHQELVARGYPAAFDDLGWLYFTERSDPAKAVALFRRGVLIGDSDSMVSLAEMIERGHAIPANPSEEKLQLYSRAAKLGNAGAARAYQAEIAKARATQQERMLQLELQRRAMPFFGTVMRNIPRL
jgi:TPR repeat protein